VGAAVTQRPEQMGCGKFIASVPPSDGAWTLADVLMVP
jgi:hypothetical protein